MKNKMTDLRNHLFEVMEALKDEEKPMDLARARAVSDVAQTIINSAKVEIEFLEIMNCDAGSEFFETPEGVDVRRRREFGEGSTRPALLGSRAG